MSQLEGFAVMDVSTAILHDPKVGRLAREYPERLTTGFLVYVATMAESWKAGERVTVEDAWPSFLAFDQASIDAIRAVKLIDARGRIVPQAWRGWFDIAYERREKSRERWRRANRARTSDAPEPVHPNGEDSAEPARLPRGANAVQTRIPRPTSVRPSVSSSKRDSPPNPPRRRGGRRNGRQLSTSYDDVMIRDDAPGIAEPDWLKADV